MAISTADGVVGAAKQQVRIQKASVTATAASWEDIFQAAGTPGAGALSLGTNTPAGAVCDDTVTGYPALNTFGGGATGYLAAVDYACSVPGRFALKDRIYHVGTISALSLATTTLSTQPSILARCPDGAGVGNEIWLEFVTAVSATATTVAVTYTNSSGVAGRTTGAISINGLILGRLLQLPLQAGDSGVQKIESIIVGGTVATTGTFNVIIARPLWEGGRVGVANGGDIHGVDKTLLPILYATSALWPMYAPDSTATGIAELLLTVING